MTYYHIVTPGEVPDGGQPSSNQFPSLSMDKMFLVSPTRSICMKYKRSSNNEDEVNSLNTKRAKYQDIQQNIKTPKLKKTDVCYWDSKDAKKYSTYLKMKVQLKYYRR